MICRILPSTYHFHFIAPQWRNYYGLGPGEPGGGGPPDITLRHLREQDNYITTVWHYEEAGVLSVYNIYKFTPFEI
jgi:hypothetical protein